MQVLIDEITEQILKEREALSFLDKDPTITQKKSRRDIIIRKIDILRWEAYEIAKKTHHPCPIMFLFYGEHEAKFGLPQ